MPMLYGAALAKGWQRRYLQTPKSVNSITATLSTLRWIWNVAKGLLSEKSILSGAFPTLFFIDGEGEIVLQVRGARNIEGFIELGNQALNRIDRTAEYTERYESGDRDPAFIYNYVQALNRSGESSLKVSNEYLNAQTDLTHRG